MAPLSRSEESIGWIVTQIMASRRVEGLGIERGWKYCYFNSLMESRLAVKRAYDSNLKMWIENQWFLPVYEEMKKLQPIKYRQEDGSLL